MNRSSVPAAALLLLLHARPVAAQAPAADPIRDGYLRFFGGEVVAAQRHFEARHATNPEDLHAWFGALIVMESRVVDDESLGPGFESGIDRFIAHAERRYERSRSDADALFYLAQAHLLRGTYRVEHDKGMWGAARDGAKSKGYSDAYVKQHPEHGDAYLALGLYNYYVDIAPTFLKVLRVLLFLPAGHRAEGLKQLERAARDGNYFAPLAESALAEAYGSLEGRLAEAIPRAERQVQRFPRHPRMRFSLAEMYLHPAVEDYDAAARQYQAVLEQAPAMAADFPTAWIEATLGLANLRRTQWRLEEAIALVTPIVERRLEKPAWVMPTALLRRGNYRMLLNDPGAAEDARRVRADAKARDWHKIADTQLAAIASRGRNSEGAIYAALIPGNRLVVEDKWVEAAAVYDRVGATNPGDWQVRYRRAYLQFARGDYPAAAAEFAAIATAPRLPGWLKAAALLNLAWTHDIAGRRQEALKLYRRIVDEHEQEAAAGSARLGLIAPYRGRPARS